jgi:hypothetical protein
MFMFLMLSLRCTCKSCLSLIDQQTCLALRIVKLTRSSIIGALSRTQAPAFSTALLFAQEYAMLAVSEEDRPFMPVTTVVLEGVPRDMKALFRHWNDTLIPAAGLMSGKLGRGKSLRIVGLEKAIEATRR